MVACRRRPGKNCNPSPGLVARPALDHAAQGAVAVAGRSRVEDDRVRSEVGLGAGLAFAALAFGARVQGFRTGRLGRFEADLRRGAERGVRA